MPAIISPLRPRDHSIENGLDNEALHWAIIQTAATLVGWVALVFTGAALINQRYLRLRDNDLGRELENSAKMSIFRANNVPFFKVIRGERTILPSVPTVGGLIEAGDLGMWTSATLSSICASPAQAGWIPLMENIVCSIHLARSRDPTMASVPIPPEMETLLCRSKNLLSSNHPLVSRLRFYDGTSSHGPKLVNCIRKLDICLLNPGMCNGSPPPPPTSRFHPPTMATTPLWLLNSGFSVPISSHEVRKGSVRKGKYA